MNRLRRRCALISHAKNFQIECSALGSVSIQWPEDVGGRGLYFGLKATNADDDFHLPTHALLVHRGAGQMEDRFRGSRQIIDNPSSYTPAIPV